MESRQNKKALFLPLVVAASIFVLLFFLTHPAPQQVETESLTGSSTVTIDGVLFAVDVADTPVTRIQGLSGKESLLENEGMFFVFDEEAPRSFWMKEMFFPIDIIWIDEEFTIVDITRNARPESYPETFSPNYPAQYVLEINAGLSEKHNFSIGDKVELETK